MRLTVIVDNLCGSSNLLGEHGLSIMIETPRGNLLFDTGQGHSLLHNLRELGFSPEDITRVCLSHGHYDHCGGLPQLLSRKPSLELWASRAVQSPHFSVRSGIPAFIGMDFNLEHRSFFPIDEPVEVIGGLWAFTVPTQKREKTSLGRSGLVVPDGSGGWIEDPFEDDISLLALGLHGPSLILGCAHSGVMNIMRHVKNTFGYNSFYAIVGGTHLSSVPRQKLLPQLERINDEFDVKLWRPNHCTGFTAASALASKHNDVAWGSSGMSLEL
nr:MBL fold metallo-hydrolase [uncultured Dethiosulfovibrio sp.]